MFFHLLTSADRKRLVAAIQTAEQATSGEIRVRVQARCGDDPVRDAAKVFERLGMTRTKESNGVRIFVAWRTRRFAVIGDIGIHRHVGDSFWQATAAAMTPLFVCGDWVGGLEAGARAAGEALRRHFPHRPDDINELSNAISEG